MGDLIKKWKSHGDYAIGYADAFNEGVFDPDGCELEPYQVGFDAGMDARNMFSDAGFSFDGNGGSISFELRGK